MKTLSKVSCLMAAVAFLGIAPAKAADAAKPKVEVVFCLDTTGSMGGLIEAAKQKIWAISNQIVTGKPTPDLKIGLVAYRDRSDQYITQVYQLNDDLDAVHGNLRKFTAQGGGDGPESVNQALDDAVNKIKWSKDDKTLKIIFLVGDAPPHMDYKDDVKYPETCKVAVKKNIIINTVQCGGDSTTKKVWEEISAKAEGSYVAIAQNGGAVAIKTPFDARLGEINRKLATTTIVYGRGKARELGEAKKEAAATLPAAPAADRIAALAKGGKVAAYDLADAIRANKVKLQDLKDTELPKELQGKTMEQKKEYLKKIEAEREKLRKEVLDLDKKRSSYIKKELEKQSKTKKSGFDVQVLEMLRKQAKKHGIKY